MSENPNSKSKKSRKLTISEESVGELKAGNLTCKPLYNNATRITSRSGCIQPSVSDVK